MAKTKKSALGRGLESILGDVEVAYTKELESGKDSMVLEIEVDKISPNPYQPRYKFDEVALNELSASIKKHGLIQPIIVIKKDDGYQLIAGERRLRATKLLGENKIKAIIADMQSQNLRELALIENIQRQDLNPLELAKSYEELIKEYNITQEDLSNIIKKSRSQITNTLRILTLSDETKEALNSEKITQGHAKIMVGLDKDDEKKVLDTIIGQKLTVRDAEDLIKKIKNAKIKNSDKTQVKNSVDESIKNELQTLKTTLQNFGKVKIKDKSITIKFDKLSQIENLLKKIDKNF
ncbi:MAG: ParB/RepB/Spo0J family partition protein [Campylobacter sp.]|nr:ParB/RepB/Spo0J family partition protein [Campylobacter sp.]